MIKILSFAASSTAVIPDPELFILYSKTAKTSSTLSTGEVPEPTSAASNTSPTVTVNTSAPIVTL